MNNEIKPGEVMVVRPEQLEPLFTNIQLITHTPDSFILDFAQFMPGDSVGMIKGRVVMTRQQMKLFLKTINENVKTSEQSYGAIPDVPQTVIAKRHYN